MHIILYILYYYTYILDRCSSAAYSPAYHGIIIKDDLGGGKEDTAIIV